MNDSAEIEIRAYPWKLLYLVGGAAALITVIFFRRNISAELSISQGFGIFPVPATLPDNALDWFALLQKHPFVGLALLDFFDLINYALVGLIFLALYAALKKVNPSLMLIAISTGLTGVAVYLASNQAWALPCGSTTKTQYSVRSGKTDSRNTEYSGFFPSAEDCSRRSNSRSSINHAVVPPIMRTKSLTGPKTYVGFFSRAMK